MQDDQREIRSLYREELEADLRSLGLPAYRAGQVFRWLHRGAGSFGEMSDLPKDLRDALEERYRLAAPRALRRQESADGTVKYLWRLWDGNAVESVVMRYRYGNTVCISSQVGCRQGCVFCASSGLGLVRDLSAGEMLEEVLYSWLDSGAKITGVVLMGIGEPLENYGNVMRFLRLVNAAEGLNIGMRHISLSTCGLVPQIGRLAEEDLQLTLSVSLHAPDDETRKKLMPVARRYDLASLMEACGAYYERTGRRISFEYAPIRGVNDSPEQMALLAERMRRVHGHVNLIPLNRVPGSSLEPGNARELARRLQQLGCNATVRRRLGADIDAACGQLRRKEAT
ncbi:MAG: 23S rRNA (adenine(2503)-C(2))-methyltransferase RlmN [Oscillospiraceae bacterium]|nr:23S rRNA (adenine(2503)-C(2))-methyltransferase RlmN [Oscillospiraceae bacterium]